MKKTIAAALILTVLFANAYSQGFYLEFNISSSGKEANMSGTMKSYYQNENSRSEFSMTVPQLGSNEITMVSLLLKDSPGKVFMVDDKNKSYSEIDTGNDDDWKDAPVSDYDVTVVGTEKVNGYNATHVRIQRKGSKTPQEYWVSKDVVGYADMMKMKTKYTGKDNMMKAMEEKGASGFPVRIKTTEQGNAIQIDLVKAEKRNNAAMLFSLDGYSKSTTGTIIPAGIDVQQMMKDVQQMTPEERERWMKEMQKQYKAD